MWCDAAMLCAAIAWLLVLAGVAKEVWRRRVRRVTAASQRQPGHPYRDAAAVPASEAVDAPADPKRGAMHLAAPVACCPACGAQNVAACGNCQTEAPLGLTDAAGLCVKRAVVRDYDEGATYTSSCGGKRQRIERVSAPVYCGPGSRFRWWRHGIGACATPPSPHMHQNCRVCGATWTTGLMGGDR